MKNDSGRVVVAKQAAMAEEPIRMQGTSFRFQATKMEAKRKNTTETIDR